MAGEMRFLRCVSGKTLGSDDEYIRKLKERIRRLKEEFNVENCGVILAFCPVLSPTKDIQSAVEELQNISETKPAVLVVLHHTFDPEAFLPDSSRSVNRENTLTVDCLFEEDRGLLQCYRNQEALDKVTQWIKHLKALGIIQQYNPLGALCNMVPNITNIPILPSCLRNSDTKQQKDSTMKAGQPEAEKAEFTNKLQENKKLFKQIQETLSSIKNNTNPNHLEDEQHANLIKHLREIEQELNETSAEVKIPDGKTPTNKETISSPPPPNTSKDTLDVSSTETWETLDDKESENTEKTNLTASPDQNTQNTPNSLTEPSENTRLRTDAVVK